jgi:hypothetical protein
LHQLQQTRQRLHLVTMLPSAQLSRLLCRRSPLLAVSQIQETQSGSNVEITHPRVTGNCPRLRLCRHLPVIVPHYPLKVSLSASPPFCFLNLRCCLSYHLKFSQHTASRSLGIPPPLRCLFTSWASFLAAYCPSFTRHTAPPLHHLFIFPPRGFHFRSILLPFPAAYRSFISFPFTQCSACLTTWHYSRTGCHTQMHSERQIKGCHIPSHRLPRCIQPTRHSYSPFVPITTYSTWPPHPSETPLSPLSSQPRFSSSILPRSFRSLGLRLDSPARMPGSPPRSFTVLGLADPPNLSSIDFDAHDEF